MTALLIVLVLTAGVLPCRPMMKEEWPWLSSRAPSCISDNPGESPIVATFDQRWPRKDEEFKPWQK